MKILLNRKLRDELTGERGGVIAWLVWTLVLLLLLVVVPFFILGKIVPPDSIGIRQNYFSVWGLWTKGYEQKGLEPGLHLQIPGITTIHLLPRGFRFIHFHDTERGSALDQSQARAIRGEDVTEGLPAGQGHLGTEHYVRPVLEVPTKDGSKVKTDVTFVVRLFENAEEPKPEAKGPAESTPIAGGKGVPLAKVAALPHGGPQDLIRAFTIDPKRQIELVSQTLESEFKKSMSELSTTEFYNSAAREEAALAANEGASRDLNPRGVEVWGTLIRRYIYSDENIDDQIFDKNLQDQTERLNAASSRYEAAKANTEQQSALWDAKIRDLSVEGETRDRVTRSEGDLYLATKSAEGERLVREAKAEIDAARASALSELQGAEVYVAREMAPLLATLNGGIVTGIDPFDINAWVTRLVGPEKQQEGR